MLSVIDIMAYSFFFMNHASVIAHLAVRDDSKVLRRPAAHKRLQDGRLIEVIKMPRAYVSQEQEANTFGHGTAASVI